ncbi:synaptic vesicle transporter [Acrodontium crateriforme]|uniref:Synaptic vesicle transporter n=1 Tax=Acrodontium crateriforme TaxID=150365 RepID=A0AAQ3M3U3_9PEZI|nr:synaptic vesicle transporter [Acrodontium crateriforme]
MASEKDVESGKTGHIPHLQQVWDQAGITKEVEEWNYAGSGTEEDPYVVTWIDNDPRNPMLYSSLKKWSITALVAIATLAVAFVSSAYSGGAKEVIMEFECSQEVYTLGISLFVIGFAIGPLLWAPLSELFGRQVLFATTYAALTAFNAGAAGAKNIQTLLLMRFFAGSFGSSPLTNAGGVLADMFPAKQRGLSLSFFAAAPFLGPVIGPIVGGFVGETIGWRWVEGIMAIFTGVLWIMGVFLIPETYPPVLQRKRAAELSKRTGKVYKSRGDVEQGPTTFGHVFAAALSRPWVLLFREPIVLLLSIYMAIIYGTLYMMFGAFPIVYQQQRGWSPGIGGLAFLGVAIGMLGAVAYSIWDNKRYARISDENKGFAPPEARLPICMIGGVSISIGLFWFAWTNSPSIHYLVSIAAGIPFGFGMVLVFLGIMNYLIDSYTIFAASVLAANAVLRSIFGAAFPLFTAQMYANLGIHWASSIPAFLALACVPFPFLFYKYGKRIRTGSKYAALADAFMRRMQAEMQRGSEESDEDKIENDSDEKTDADTEKEAERKSHAERREEEEEQEAIDYSYEDEQERIRQHQREQPHFEGIKTTTSRSAGARRPGGYESNPFDLDRVNTRESFKNDAGKLSRTSSRASRFSRK